MVSEKEGLSKFYGVIGVVVVLCALVSLSYIAGARDSGSSLENEIDSGLDDDISSEISSDGLQVEDNNSTGESDDFEDDSFETGSGIGFDSRDEKIKRLEERIASLEEKMQKLDDFKKFLLEHNGTVMFGGREIRIMEGETNRKNILAGEANATTDLNLTAEDIGGDFALRAIMSNGFFREVKVMPDTASEKALQRLKAKCAETGCRIELKEVSSGNESRASWVVQAEKDSRLLLVFKKKMHLEAKVDSETGDVVEVDKPWWSFMAKEKDSVQ